jgi:molybdenum cofactor cytidylyltransferase
LCLNRLNELFSSLIWPASVAVILAAGASTRMGVPKQLLQFGGEAMLRRASSVALKAGCRPVVVVTGADAAASRKALRGLDVRETENQQWESGISSSVRVGIEALSATSEVMLVPSFEGLTYT